MMCPDCAKETESRYICSNCGGILPQDEAGTENTEPRETKPENRLWKRFKGFYERRTRRERILIVVAFFVIDATAVFMLVQNGTVITTTIAETLAGAVNRLRSDGRYYRAASQFADELKEGHPPPDAEDGGHLWLTKDGNIAYDSGNGTEKARWEAQTRELPGGFIGLFVIVKSADHPEERNAVVSRVYKRDSN